MTSSLVDGMPRGAAVFKVPSKRTSTGKQGKSSRGIVNMKRCAAAELHSRSASITATGYCWRKGAFVRIHIREQRNVRQSLDVTEHLRGCSSNSKPRRAQLSRTCHRLWAELRA